MVLNKFRKTIADRQEALQEVQEALRLRPDFAEAHQNLALLLDHDGRTDEAVAHYRETLRLNPRDALTHYRLGCILKDADKDEEAAKEFSAACALEPNNSRVCRK